MEIKEVVLKKLRFQIRTAFSGSILDDLIENVEVDLAPFLVEAITVRVQAFVWGEEVETIDIRYPVDWWEAFKERWFPNWALARWPIRYVHRHIVIYATYPEFRPAAHPVVFQSNDQETIETGQTRRFKAPGRARARAPRKFKR